MLKIKTNLLSVLKKNQQSPVSDSSSSASDFAFDKENVDLFRRNDLVERDRCDLYDSSITDSCSGSDIG